MILELIKNKKNTKTDYVIVITLCPLKISCKILVHTVFIYFIINKKLSAVKILDLEQCLNQIPFNSSSPFQALSKLLLKCHMEKNRQVTS